MSRNPLPRNASSRFTGFESIEQVEQAFWSKVAKRGPDECWLWQASLNQRGYGQFFAKAFPVARTAHRWSFYFEHGELPEREVGHRCDTPACVNPAHLEDVTRLKNEQDKTERGRRPTGPKETPCGKCGGPRTLIQKRGDGRTFMVCEPCHREYQRQYHRKRTR